MRRVAIKPAAQQADALTLSARELLVAQRTQTMGALRGHAAEFGVVVAGGAGRVAELLAAVAQDAGIPQAARSLLAFLGQQVAHLDREIAKLEVVLLAQHKANPVIRYAKPPPRRWGRASAWLLSLLERRPKKLAAVAPGSSQGQVWPTKPAPAQAGDGPHRVGHDDDRRGVSASAARGRRLTGRRCQECRSAGVPRGDDDRPIRGSRTPRPDHRRPDAADLFGAGSRNPSGPAAGAAQTGRTHDRTSCHPRLFAPHPLHSGAVHT
jgi:hypothetical protein